MNINLNALSLKELVKLARDVAKAIASTEARQRKDARVAMEKVAKEYGVSVAEALGNDPEKAKPIQKKKRTVKSKKAAPKYKNPQDASQTWSGQGRRPGWYVAAVKAGKTDADLSI